VWLQGHQKSVLIRAIRFIRVPILLRGIKKHSGPVSIRSRYRPAGQNEIKFVCVLQRPGLPGHTFKAGKSLFKAILMRLTPFPLSLYI
jgi:hypothetical protein